MQNGSPTINYVTIKAKMMTLKTLDEKKQAYYNFMNSSNCTLVVVGMNHGAEGKSYALQQVKGDPNVTNEIIVFYGDTPMPCVYPNSSNDTQDVTDTKVIYHLYISDIELIEGLKKKYNADVVYFERP